MYEPIYMIVQNRQIYIGRNLYISCLGLRQKGNVE